MRIKAGTLAVEMTADGRDLEATLKRADSLTEAFSENVDRRMRRAGNSMRGVGQAAGMTEKEVKSLEDRMRQGMAADTASRALDNLRRYAGLTSQEYERLAARMGVATREGDKASASLTGLAKRAGAVAAAYLSVREGVSLANSSFMSFLGYEADLTDMARVTTESLGGVDATIKALPRSMGDPQAMMQAYYQVLSSGATDSAQSMDLLTTSAKASKAAHVAQAETVKGLTKLLAGFDGEIRSAAEASDLLFRIDNLGQTSFAELVPVIGDVAEVTHLVGVSSQEMAAGLALVTQTSGSTSEAATKWKAIMVGLYKPTENLEKVLKALGYESGQAMVKQLGFAGTLQKLQAVAEKSGFSMGKLFESSEALTGIAGLGAQEWERYTGILDGVRNGSNETEQAWQRWIGTSQAVKDNYDATLKQLAIEFGGELAPMMTKGMQSFADTVVANKGPIITTLGGIEASIQAITSMVMAATREYQTFANSIAAGIAVVKGEMAFGDWALSGPEELAKKLQAAGDKMRAETERQAKEARSQALMAGDNAGTIPELAAMFPSLEGKAQKAKKAVDGITVALKKGAGDAGAAAERYTERADAYFEQVQYTIAGLTDSLTGGLESETLKVDKAFQKIFSDIRKNMVGAKGDTEGFSQAWAAAEAAWPVLRMTAQIKDFAKEIDRAARYARDMGTFQADPAQLQAADWLEGYKQYLEDLRAARATTDQEDAAAVAKGQARWDAYQQHVLKAELDRLGEGGKLSEAYWASEKTALENHLAAVKANASDETAYKVYEAKQWDQFLKAQLEEQAKYAGTFGETLAAKWSLAFGGYESETTKARKRWDAMSDGMIEATDGMIEGVSGGIGDLIRNIGNGTVSIEDLWQNMLARMLDAFASFVEELIKTQLKDLVGGLFSGSGSGSGGLSLSSLFGGSSSSSGWSGTGFSGDVISRLGKSIGQQTGETFSDVSNLGDVIERIPSIEASIADSLKPFGDVWSAQSSFWSTDGKTILDANSFGKAITKGTSSGWADALTGIGAGTGLGTMLATALGADSTTGALSSGIGSAVGAALGSVIPGVGTLLGGIIGGAGGGLLGSLFGQAEEEIKKVASGYNVAYAGGHAYASGVDFYSDGSVVSTGVTDPAVTKKISDSFRTAAENLSDFAEELGFATDVLEGFAMPSMNITSDQLDTYIAAGSNMMAFKGLMEAGLRGAFDAVARDGEVYSEEYSRLATSLRSVKGGFEAWGYELKDVAQISQADIDSLRTKNTEVAQGTGQAMLSLASAMGATSDQLAELTANASDGSEALAVTDEQLSNILEADYASELLDAVGGEDAFASIMGNLTANVFDTIEAYAENLDYYNDKAADSIAKLGDASVTVDNFWAKFDAAIKGGLTVDEFEAWGKASAWVANINSVTDALADWNDAMIQMAQSLDVRKQKAAGLDYEAELTQLAADAEWELAAAREAGYDAAVIARLQEVQAAELAAKIAEHQADYADKLRDANKRYATAVGDSSALVAIAIEENARELDKLAKTFNWSPGSSEEGLFQALQQAQWAEIINMIEETADSLAAATRAMRADLDARRAAIAGYDDEAEAIQMVAGYAEELRQAYANDLDEDLIAELMQVQLDELAKYWSDLIDGMRSDLEDLYRQQSDLLDSLSGNTQSAIEELYALFARYQAGETDLADSIIDSLKSIANAINAMVEDIYATIYDVRTGGEYTTDNAATVAANTKAYFEEQYALAASGDTSAMANVTSYARDYLSSLRASTADQSVYESGVDYVTSMLSRLANSGTGVGSELSGIGETVIGGQIEAAQEAIHRAEVAQLKAHYDALWDQTTEAFKGSDIAKYIQGLATTGAGWQGLTDLFIDYEGDGQTVLQELQNGSLNYASYIGWFQDNYGTGTGYVDWAGAMQVWSQYGTLPDGVSTLYGQAMDAYDSWQALKTQYGFATGGMIEGGIPGEDSVFVLGKPGEAVLTEQQTDMLLLLAERIQGVMLGGAAPAAAGRDDVASEVAELRREVAHQGDRLRQTQERLVDNTQAIASMLTRCGGKEGYLTVVQQ